MPVNFSSNDPYSSKGKPAKVETNPPEKKINPKSVWSAENCGKKMEQGEMREREFHGDVEECRFRSSQQAPDKVSKDKGLN